MLFGPTYIYLYYDIIRTEQRRQHHHSYYNPNPNEYAPIMRKTPHVLLSSEHMHAQYVEARILLLYYSWIPYVVE